MEYSNDELTRRVKWLEYIVQTLIEERPIGGLLCRNASLHIYDFEGEHPRDLEVPHYTFQPQIAWDRDIIGLGVIESVPVPQRRLVPYNRDDPKLF
jgi:hypothetical protein